MKIVIYLDILLLVNFVAGYLLLCAVGRISGAKASVPRLLAAGAVSAATSLLILIPPLPAPVQPLLKAMLAMGITRIAFPWQGWRMLARQTLWFFLLNLLVAGASLLASLRYGVPGLQVNNLTVYLNLSPMLLLGCMLASYLSIRIFLALFGPPRQREIWQFTVPLEEGRVLHLSLLHDTGFFLKDPYNGAQTVLVEFAACAAQLPPDLRTYLAGCFDQTIWPEPPPGRSVRLLECRTASGRRLLPAMAVQGAVLQREKQRLFLRELTLVFSPEHSMGGQFAGLFGSELLETRFAQKQGGEKRWISVK